MHSARPILQRHLQTRLIHTTRPRQAPTPPSNIKPPTPTPTPPSRIARLEARLPSFLRRIVAPLRAAPVSHVTAFLVLHELTAIIPLVGLAATFHYTQWLPPLFGESVWVKEGTERFGRWMRKKGWLGPEDEHEAMSVVTSNSKTEDKAAPGMRRKWWDRGEGGVGLLVEVATAYAVTKALLPLRLLLSVWATPWFARWTVLPVTNAMRRRLGRSVG